MKSIIKYTYLLLLLVGFSACEDEFIEKQPLDEVAPETLFETEAGFRTALDGVYAAMKGDFLGYNFCIYTIPENINDDIIAGSQYGFTFENTHADIHPLNYDYQSFQLEGFWKFAYEAINNANSIIKYGQNSSLRNKDQFVAEALAQRALIHYDLYRFFAPAYAVNTDALAVPYRLETDELLVKKPRNTVQEVITYVLDDLNRAEKMATNDVNSYRISKTAIQALLARVYHETGDYENAIKFAKEALKDTRYDLDTDVSALENQWRQDDSNEIIFRIRFDEKDNGSNAAMFAIPLYSSFPYYVSNDLLNLYDQANDIRFDVYFESDPMGSGNYYPEKHVGMRTADYDNYQAGAVDIKLIRVPELYLIIAESEARTGASDADNYLNALRNARGIGDYSGDLLTEVMNERRRELAFEGFRFTDLKRLEMGFTRPDGSGLPANSPRFALPIPKLEIDRSGIQQNPGY
ncbi:RagB/SusD family nutrient uptake outer membrane protein [Marinifilum fragile]|uniref:RagB/SusD family nutrient uptake outer membrane protein n=1 Tax=Marinifilum fragile TaxID=570161 RepID=UPI002AA6D7CE|nr:RagB/SusD family nutrient uptake outer membrane protein [Marinifilum fragile]